MCFGAAWYDFWYDKVCELVGFGMCFGMPWYIDNLLVWHQNTYLLGLLLISLRVVFFPLSTKKTNGTKHLFL